LTAPMRLLTEVSITGKALSRHILIVATIASNVLCGVVRTEATSPEVMQQIQGLLEEKAARTPAQQKIGSHLIYAWKLSRGEPIANGVQTRSVARW